MTKYFNMRVKGQTRRRLQERERKKEFSGEKKRKKGGLSRSTKAPWGEKVEKPYKEGEGRGLALVKGKNFLLQTVAWRGPKKRV